MIVDRGIVVWSDDPFREDPNAGRPWLVINNERQPFRDEQSMSVALSTSGYEAAIPIEPEDWRQGNLPRQSYALPWAVHSLEYRHVDRQLGKLAPALVDRITDDLWTYVERSR